MKHVHFTLAALAAAVLFGCQEADLTPPSIALVANGSLAPGEAEVWAGTPLNVTIELTDNEELGSVRIDLHDAAGHSHDGEEAELILFSGAEDWALLETSNLAGTQRLLTKSYDIPGHIRGMWDLVVDLTDAEGNEAETAYLQVHVENDSIPLFVVPYTTEPVWSAGSSVALAGDLTDADGLLSGVARLRDHDGTLITEQNIPLSEGDLAADLSLVSFNIPTDAGGEELEVELEATDLAGQTCLTSFHVEIE